MTVPVAEGTERSEAARAALRRCELACRALAEACSKASDAVLAMRGPGAAVCASAVMDTWHTAGATARLIARPDDHDPRVLIMVIAVMKQIVAESAAIATVDSPAALATWSAAARACGATAGEALAHLWERTLAGPPTWDDVTSPLPLALTITQEI